MSDAKWTKAEILVLAVDELSRKAFERALTDHGYEPLLASSHADAKTLAEKHAFTLCVIDTHDICVDCATDFTRRLLSNDPTARAIIIHDVKIDQERFGGASSRVCMLHRPFPMLEFISSVNDALSVKQ